MKKKTIKIIDLLNKIANGEEVPKKIKYQFKTFELNEEYRYMRVDKVEYDYGLKTLMEYVLECDLNYEVEIIEEQKIEELDDYEKYPRIPRDEFETQIMKYIALHKVKINELIKKVDELEKEKKNDK